MRKDGVSIGCQLSLAKVSINSIKVGEAHVAPVSSARNLGVCFDSHLDMCTHISETCGSVCYYLYNIKTYQDVPLKGTY